MTHLISRTALSLAIVALAACGGGGGSGGGDTGAANTPPASAAQSSGGFIDYLQAVVAREDDAALPVGLAGFVAPTDDRGEPVAL